MDGGAWWAAAQAVTKSCMTERLTRTFMCGTMESLKKGIISIKVDGETANSPILEHHEA